MDATVNNGRAAEDLIELFAERAFFPDFLFRNNVYAKGQARRETADVLIWFDSTVLAVQSKSRSPATAGSRRSLEREVLWARKHLAHALRQVKGSRRALLSGRVQYLENERRGRIAFERDQIDEVHGIILMDQQIDAYDPVELVPELLTAGFPVHVFALSEWSLICSEMSTTPDFLSYLRFRAKHLGRGPMRVGSERDLIASFIIANREPDALIDVSSIPGLGNQFAREYGHAIARRNAEDLQSYVVDDIVEQLHDVDAEASTSLAIMLDPPDYMKVAVELSRLNRVQRRELGRKIHERLDLAIEGQRERYSALEVNGTIILFLATPEPRPSRSERLLQLTSLVKQARATRIAIGIATEASRGEGRSLDTVYIDAPWEEIEGADEIIAKVFSPPKGRSVTEFATSGH